MELRSIDGESSISLTEWEADDIGIKAAIAVRDGTFTGASDEVWFFRDAFAAFVRALDHLIKRHEGDARLDSMSPEEVLLSIRSLDSARHVLVEAQIAGQAKAHGIPREQVIRDVLLAQQPNKRFATVEELGALTVFLASEAAASITGVALPVDGGWTAH
jgi:NAD(P)-dependent dehydrogenase (short-subunit alcohol dehydrogenase family)